jgi:putative ABC transport system permease protein
MLPLVLRGFAQRKLRVFLTGTAVALGVALMAGTYILTDTINHSFAGIFKTANEGSSVVISPLETLGNNSAPETSPITQKLLEEVRSTPGVAKAAGSIFTPGTFLKTNRKRVTTGGAPDFIASLQPQPFESFKPVKGRFPRTASEVAIDEATAKRGSLHIGEQMIVAGEAVARRYTIVGILKFASGQSFGGAGTALLIPSEAQRVLGEKGRFDEISVAATSGTTPAQLRDTLKAALPHSVTVRTGEEQAKKDTSNLEENLEILKIFLLIFAYVALVVGAFIIFNTFSITVAQRTREFGLLRTLGASRRQVMLSVFEEGLILGVGGAVIGLLAGFGAAPALDDLFKLFGAELPDTGSVLELRTVIVSLAAGILITVAAGLPPALRATRVPPLAAMREGIEIPRPLPTRRQLIARFVIIVVVALILAVTIGAGIGIVVIVLAGARFARLVIRLRRGGERPAPRYRIVPALARTIGSLFSWRGITARLAKENSIRQPGRTLVTAAALAIGITLVTFVAVLADGFKATINQAVDRSFAGNLIVESSQGGEEQGIPTLVAATVRKVPGVKAVTPVAFTEGRRKGTSSNVSVTAIEPSTFENVYKVEWEHGSPATLLQLGETGTVLSKSYAKKHNIDVGATLDIQTPSNHFVKLKVLGIAQDNTSLFGELTISRELAHREFALREDGFDLVEYESGRTDAEVQPAIERVLRNSFPQTRARTAAQFKKEQARQIDTFLTLIYVLLALSVIVSLFGIVNTLVLSVYERTRELGMMRAIGTSRRQIRQMIRYESVITALIGGVFGIVIGVVASVLTTTFTLKGQGYVQAVPIGTLVVLLVIAALAGVFAALMPARRAAKVDVLRALMTE